MAQMTKKQVVARFEKAQMAAGRTTCLSSDSNGCYSYAWMRYQFEGWLLCAIDAGILADTPENRSLELWP